MRAAGRSALLAILLAVWSVAAGGGHDMVTEVFLLAGQSNMDGRGDGGQLTPEDRLRLDAARDRVSLAYNGRRPAPLDVSVPLPHIARKFGLESTFGPELFFGIRLAEAWPGKDIHLVKRSLGGTSLYGAWNPHWSRDKAALMNEADRPQLFRELVNDIAAMEARFGGRPFRYAGMLWVQGETDSNVQKFGPLPAASYGANLKALIRAVREVTGEANLPFYLLQVGGGDVVEGMRSAAAEMANVHFIPQSKDPESPAYLPGYGPPVGHYNYEGMKRIGLRFAAEVLNNR